MDPPTQSLESAIDSLDDQMRAFAVIDDPPSPILDEFFKNVHHQTDTQTAIRYVSKIHHINGKNTFLITKEDVYVNKWKVSVMLASHLLNITPIADDAGGIITTKQFLNYILGYMNMIDTNQKVIGILSSVISMCGDGITNFINDRRKYNPPPYNHTHQVNFNVPDFSNQLMSVGYATSLCESYSNTFYTLNEIEERRQNNDSDEMRECLISQKLAEFLGTSHPYSCPFVLDRVIGFIVYSLVLSTIKDFEAESITHGVSFIINEVIVPPTIKDIWEPIVNGENIENYIVQRYIQDITPQIKARISQCTTPEKITQLYYSDEFTESELVAIRYILSTRLHPEKILRITCLQFNFLTDSEITTFYNNYIKLKSNFTNDGVFIPHLRFVEGIIEMEAVQKIIAKSGTLKLNAPRKVKIQV